MIKVAGSTILLVAIVFNVSLEAGCLLESLAAGQRFRWNATLRLASNFILERYLAMY